MLHKLSNRLSLRLTIQTLIFSLAFLAASSVAAQATTIIVNTGGQPVEGPSANDGLCSLAEAIWNINATGRPWTDCARAGSGSPRPQNEIIIDSSVGEIVLDRVLRLEQPALIRGPSPEDKTVIRPSDPTSSNGGMIIETVLNNPKDFELRNLRFQEFTKTYGVSELDFPCGVENGGALCVMFSGYNHSLTLRDVEFVNNSTEDNVSSFRAGGAVAIYYTGPSTDPDRPDVLIENTLFDNNFALDSGGALQLTEVKASLQNVKAVNNRTGRGSGAAISARNVPRLTINRSTLMDNEETDGEGAAIWFEGGKNLFIFNSLILDNIAYDLINGALIPNRGAVVRAAGYFAGPPANVILGNVEIGSNAGAGVLLKKTNAIITTSTIHGNLFDSTSGVDLSGAGISIEDSTLDLVNSTIVDNLGRVGGIDARASTLNLNHVTVADNRVSASPETGGIRLDNTSTANLDGTLLAGNPGASGNATVVGGSTLNAYSSQFGDSAVEINGTNAANAFSNVSSLDPIQDMGCTTQAGYSVGARCVRLAPLAAGAVALDRSDPATLLTSDQRGSLFTRATGGGNLPDIGAHELQPPIISIDPNTTTSFNEGSSGITPFPFTLLRNGDTRDISFANWNVFGEGAFPATVPDFNATSGSAFFDIGDSSTIVNVGVVGDLIVENNEGFRLALAALTNGVQGTNNTRSATIINDDALLPAALVSMSPVAINLVEGNFLIGSEQRFRITRSQVLGGICSFQVELSAVGPAGVSDEDFINRSLGTTTVAMESGQEFFDYVVQVRGDGVYEGDEAYRVELINPSGCFIDNTAASVDALIVDDESLYRVDANLASQPEGNSGITPFTFEVSRAGFIADSGSVNWEVIGFGGQPASADDFAGDEFPAGTALFLPGSDSFFISVDVVGDTIGEDDEQFAVVLTNASGGEIGVGEAVSTILNDDSTSDKIFSDRFE